MAANTAWRRQYLRRIEQEKERLRSKWMGRRVRLRGDFADSRHVFSTGSDGEVTWTYATDANGEPEPARWLCVRFTDGRFAAVPEELVELSPRSYLRLA